MPKFHWKKKKAIAMHLNRRQWNMEFLTAFTPAYEIEMEHITGSYLVTQASTPSAPNYIITE